MLKCLHEFLEVVLPRGVAMESLLANEEVWSFWSHRWITFKLLHEFLDANLLRVAMESLLGDEDVLSAMLE